MLQRAGCLALLLADSDLTRKWSQVWVGSLGLGQGIPSLLPHHWPLSRCEKSTCTGQGLVTLGTLRLGNAKLGSLHGPCTMGLKYSNSSPNYLCSPPSCHWMAPSCKCTQPGHPAGYSLSFWHLCAIFQPLKPVPLCSSSSADQFPWPQCCSAAAQWLCSPIPTKIPNFF